MLEEDLRPGERLRLARWRDVESAADAARRLGVTQYRLKLWETCKSEDDCPEVELGGMEPNEHYVVLRWRAGLTVRGLARKMSVHPQFLYEAERGLQRLDRLVEFWGA